MKLYPYQETGVAFLRQNGSAYYLADEMGLGKTVQAIIAANGLDDIRRVLVICPASAVPNWKSEVDLHADPSNRYDVRSYGKIHKPGDPEYDLVIVDEAHYCKNPKAKRTKSALKIAAAEGRAWLLSGTPMPNGPHELYAPLKYLWPQVLEKHGLTTRQKWIDRFCVWQRTPWGMRVVAARNVKQLREIMAPIMLRRTVKSVALDLPPLRVDMSLLPPDPSLVLPPEAEALAREDVNVKPKDDTPLATLRRTLGEYKAPLIARQISQELTDGEYGQIVVMAHHRDVLALFVEAFRPFGVVWITGDQTTEQRESAVSAFREGSARVFVGQQTAAGTALNLQNASEIVLVEPAWSPDDNRQAIKRIHRIGSEEPCRARIFAVADSLDEAIMRTLARKIRMQKEVLNVN